MSPDEVQALRSDVRRLDGKVDTLTSSVGDIKVAVEVLTVQAQARNDAEDARQELREITCPQGPVVRDIIARLGTVAGTQESHSQSLAVLEAWHKEARLEEATEEAVADVRMAPLKWVWAHLDRVLQAVLVVYVILWLGPKE